MAPRAGSCPIGVTSGGRGTPRDGSSVVELLLASATGSSAARRASFHALDSLPVPPPPTPTACLGLEQDVQNLVNQAQTLRNDALNGVGIVAWQKLSELGLKLLELDRKRAEYQKCVDAHTGTLVVGFSAIDAGGGGATDDRRADLWDVSGPQPVLLESVPVSSGSFAFNGSIPSGQFAVAISGTDTATSTGPDFRSGPITAAPAATPNVEIVLGPMVTLTADDISRWFAAVPAAPVQSLAVTGVGTVAVDIQSIAAALVPPALRLTGVGTLSGSVSFLGSVASPLSVTVTLGLVPTTNPNPLLPAELTLVAPPHVDISGPLAAYGAVLNAAIATFAGDWILELMRPIVQQEVSDAAARALSLVGLPPSVTLSIRKLSVTPTSVTFQPVLGAIGTVLSTYQPPAAQVVTP